MPLASLHPLPNNPTTGQQPLANLGGRGLAGPPPASSTGSGGVSRETWKGLQDVVWSDDEDDPDCLLCAEPLDLSDLNFKPCQCGMQICQFCYNKLLTSDSRCPGCRRPYDAKSVVFQPVDWEEVKRAKEKKTRRAKTIKQLTSMGRRHLLGIRVVMKNMVYVVGMKLPAPDDEAIPILRSNDYFGQYGKISKLYLRDRTTLNPTTVHTLTDDDPSTSTGIYIVYIRREDAARAISALDGIPAPQGPSGQTLRATFGTARYCDAFLRGLKCDNLGCTNLHEWGGDSDCFTKDDMETALTRPSEYDARQKQAQLVAPSLSQKSAWTKPSFIEDAIGSSALPNSAAWGKGIPIARATPRTATPIGTSRPVKSTIPTVPPIKTNAAFPLPTPSPVTPASIKEKEKRKSTSMARGKSTDSSQSATTNSNQASPKRNPASFTAISLTRNLPLAAFSDGELPPSDSLEAGKAGLIESQADDLPDESISAESEAGPSSASPPPTTPARLPDVPPPPLTAEPIFIHSPYEEPRIFSFPSSDPGFAFVLGLDDGEIQRQSAQAQYQPSPFSKTLVGLAELGILAPEVPDILSSPHGPDMNGFTGSFQPFEPPDGDLPLNSDVTAGPSRSGDAEQEGSRTTSRFDFARPSSRPSTGRGQSPFTMTRRGTEDRDMWGRGMPLTTSGGMGYNEDNRQNTPNQVGLFVGSYGSSGSMHEGGWGAAGIGAGAGGNTADSPYMTTHMPSRERQMFMKGARDREEYDQGMMQYGQTPNVLASHRLFSPDGSGGGLHDDHARTPPNFHSSHAAFQLQQQQSHGHPHHSHSHSPAGYPEARTLQQYHQRTQSPTPLPQGYRRF